jgi:hypothetical protein
MRPIEGDYRPITDPRFEMLRVANAIRTEEDIPKRWHVVHHSVKLLDRVRHVHDISTTQTAKSLPKMIADRVSHGKTIVINNAASGKVIGIKPHFEGIAVVTMNRFGDQVDESRIIRDPVYSARPLRKGKDIEFVLSIGEADEERKQGIQIASYGNIRPRPFMVATEDEILFARADITGSLSCAQEYRGVAQWYISGVKQLHPNSQEDMP